MLSNWKEVRLQDVVSILGDGLHGTPKYSEDGEYYFINGSNLDNGKIVFRDTTKKVDHEQYLKYKKDLNDRTLLVSINGTIGNVAYYNGEKVVLGKSACYFNLHEGIEKKYVRYVLSSHYFISYLYSFATGTTIKNVSLKSMREFKFKLPPLTEQKAIAHILGTLDDKIELNRQMNETLEAMAQALFKSWFVDFDPVIDNVLLAGKAIPEPLKERAEIRQAQLDSDKAKTNSEINDLFPSEFEFTEELGWIPKGWSAGNLSDVSFVKGGYAFKSKDFTDEGLPVIKIKNINDDRTVDVYGVQYIPEDIAKKSKDFFLETGDLIMAMTGATVGKFGLLVAENQQSYLLNQRVAKFTSVIDQVTKVWFTYCFLNQKSTIDHIVNIAEGSAQPNISATSIMATPLIVPTIKVINSFDSLVDGYFSKMIVNRQEVDTLSKLRDTLLPKLMSGELRIPDAEKLVEDI